MATYQDRLSRFLGHLYLVFEREPELVPIESTLPGVPDVLCMVYRDMPQPGAIVGVTYGLSEVSHPAWTNGRPELAIAVDSSDLAWPRAVGDAANRLRGQCPFAYGQVIDFRARISEESAMSAFFVFAPSMLDRKAYLGIDVGGARAVNIAGLYPIYDSERAVLAELGLERFWNHPNFDLYDVQRRPVRINANA